MFEGLKCKFRWAIDFYDGNYRILPKILQNIQIHKMNGTVWNMPKSTDPTLNHAISTQKWNFVF